jgi:hypothetical protein
MDLESSPGITRILTSCANSNLGAAVGPRQRKCLHASHPTMSNNRFHDSRRILNSEYNFLAVTSLGYLCPLAYTHRSIEKHIYTLNMGAFVYPQHRFTSHPQDLSRLQRR